MSSDGSDDDIPGLESVSSSEYMSEDEESGYEDCAEPRMPKWVDPKGQHYKTAKRWLEQDRPVIEKHLNVVTVYLYSPSLYGHAHQTDRWLRWCQEVGLLISDTDYNTGCLSEDERSAVDVLDTAMQYCRNIMKDRSTPDSLALLLQLAEEVRVQDSCKHAVRLARRRGWFMIMLQEFKLGLSKSGKTADSLLSQRRSVEVGCLYVINQTAEHVWRFVNDGYDFNKEFQEKVISDEEVGEPLKKSGDDMVKANKHKEAVEEYSTAIICCPYYYKLYTNRALAYMELKDYRSSLSDGLRAMVLNPDFPKGYIRYILALKACGETDLLEKTRDEYHRRFPSSKDRDLLKKALETANELEKRKIEPTEKDKVIHDTLMRTCKRASELYLNDNIEEAMFYYKEAIDTLWTDIGWQRCMTISECRKFIVSLHFAHGLALLKNGSSKSAELALREFNTITDEHKSMKFIPAMWGTAKALVQLHRHSGAFDIVRKALEQLPLIKVSYNMTWPGTVRCMSETLTQNVETNLQKIQQKCEPVCVPDAVCRYGNCPSHHPSTHIRTTNEDYKGHVLLACSESCLIAYHSSCWRRFKSESVINTDRDFLLTACPTPDCFGDVKTVTVYDLKGKCKIRFEPPASKVPNNVPAHQTLKENKRNIKTKSTSSERALNKKSPSDGTIEVDLDVASKAKEKEKEEEEETVSSEVGVANVEREEVVEKEEVNPPRAVSEDSRKLEDSVVVINRQAEVDEKENKDSVVSKPKGKKKKVKTTHTKEHWDDLFTLPERPARGSETSPDEEAKNIGSTWELDSESPFSPPDHLKEAIEQFESNEVPPTSNMPRPPSLASVTSSVTSITDHKPSKDFEFIFSYFKEIFKSHGGLHPTDTKLTDALTLLPEDSREAIDNTGGVRNFLLMSPSFISHGELICLSEDAPVIAASINSVGGSSSNNSGSSNGPSLSIDSDKVAYGNLKDSKKKKVKRTTQKEDRATLNSLMQAHSQSLSESDFTTKFDISNADTLKTATKTYGEELSSGVNSPVNSPLISPRLLSPVPSPKITNKAVGSGRPVQDSRSSRDNTRTDTHAQSQRKSTKSKNSADHKEKGLETKENHAPFSKHRGSGPNLPPGLERKANRSPTLFINQYGNGDKVGLSSDKGSKAGLSSDKGSKAGLSSDKGSKDKTTPPVIPKRSTSSNNGRVNGHTPTSSVGKWSSEEKLTNDWNREVEKVKSELVSGGGKDEAWREQKPVLPVQLVSIGVNACPLVTEKWVMTDTIPPVENFKDRYENVLKEKKDLHSKLERSEDQKFKLQRDHKRELERVQKQCKAEIKEESLVKIAELERRVAEEKNRVSSEKKDHLEQTRSLKSEIKSLSDKVEKLRKESVKKERQSETSLAHARMEVELAREDQRKLEDRLRVQSDHTQKALRRACDAEIELLNLRRETVLRPGEHRLREVDGICASLPPDNEYQQEWINYRDKLKTSLDCFQNAMDDQVKQVRAGRPVALLDPVPNPAVPLPPQLASSRMPFIRPPFIPMMMRPGMPPRPLDPSQLPPRPFDPNFQPRLPPATSAVNTGPIPPGSLVEPVQTQPAAVGVSGRLPPAGGPQQNLFNDPSPGASLPNDLDLGGTVGGSKKLSSFDRIVEKLSAAYPQYTKSDFKSVLREVRRNNKNTLSGLSLDTIASQIKSIIDARLKVAVGGPISDKPLTAGGVVSGKGSRRGSKGQVKKPLRPVAVAEPPKMSDIEYDNEGWCIICYEDMADEDSSILNCGHKFHSECIRSWFNEQSTCPTCRNHSLLPDEYPKLK